MRPGFFPFLSFFYTFWNNHQMTGVPKKAISHYTTHQRIFFNGFQAESYNAKYPPKKY